MKELESVHKVKLLTNVDEYSTKYVGEVQSSILLLCSSRSKQIFNNWGNFVVEIWLMKQILFVCLGDQTNSWL